MHDISSVNQNGREGGGGGALQGTHISSVIT